MDAFFKGFATPVSLAHAAGYFFNGLLGEAFHDSHSPINIINRN